MTRWHSCNILQIAPDAKRLWHFDAKGGGFVLNREYTESLPSNTTAKSWTALWQPKLNVAWLPVEHIFLRVIELPKSNFDETLAMAELQLEKLSPLPVAQIVWTIHVLPPRNMAKAEGATEENLQTVVVVIAERRAVEEFLGKLEGQSFFADRLEVPFLDQLATIPATEEGAWIYPVLLSGQNAALIAWQFNGALRSLSVVIVPPAGDRAADLKSQLAQLVWAGELDGWLTAQPKWHLVANPAQAEEWSNLLSQGLNEPVEVSPPLPETELAAHTAQRAAVASEKANLLPPEFSTRYRQQFLDRLWFHGLAAAAVLYAVCVAVYFCAVAWVGHQTSDVESQVVAISNNYTNALQLKARYDVLKEREDLKYAALDSWKLVAEQLPDGITLQRFSFADGKKVTLTGSSSPDQISAITDFSDAMRKAQLNGQPMFNQKVANDFNFRQNGNAATWNFSLQLLHSEESP
ncbi:MAG TPA: hypothetical protein VHG89_11450 [Verrucomicrobiae bacterium]|nr:hypothetical protein [Verrucomicrobiae bacterium]